MEVAEKKKVLVPNLRFREFEGNWNKSKLSQAASIKRGKFSPRPRNNPIYYNGDYPFVQTSDVVNSNGLINSFSQSLNEKGLEVSKLFPAQTILMTIAANIGYTGVLQIDMACPDSLVGIQCKSNVDPYFLNYQLFTKQARLDYLAPEAAQKNLNVQFLNPYPVSLTTLSEQQKIASFLSAVDERIQQLGRKKELLEDYKKGVMQQLFSQELRFKQEDDSDDYPDWEFVGGNELFSSVSDKNHDSDLPVLAITQDQGAIPRDMIDYNMTVTEKSIASYKVVQIGDFVISLRTFQGGIEFSNYHGICSPAYIILRPDSEKVVSEFYKNYLKTSSYIKLLQRTLEGIRDGKMISYKYFSEIKLPLPSVPEQQKIANFLSAIDEKIEAVSAQIEHSRSFKKGLLQQMFL